MYQIKDKKFIGIRIRGRRIELGWTQEKLAESIGVTYQQLQRYEGGKSNLNTDRLQALSNALDIPISFLFEEKADDRIQVKESERYISPEEREFIEYLRKIDNEDYKNCIKNFLILASGKKKKR
ncbi:MAG: helix-turn-helix domain-containing protein [Nitrospirae bacterium]|nr:helix-turn-helix domain-containing protein [Nitrospirota bacterium]